MLRHSFALLLVIGACAPARGQTTRPADEGGTPTGQTVSPIIAAPVVGGASIDPAWAKAVEAFAKAAAAGDAATVERMLSPRATVQRFDSPHPSEAAQLVGRLGKSALVGQHAYVHPPLVMAADVAADFKNAVGIPERAKVKYLVDDEQDIKRANATAVQWVVEQLDVHAGTPVGVVVLWTPRAVVPGVAVAEGAATHDVTFVLCRAEEVAAHEYRINAVVFGVPVGDGN